MRKFYILLLLGFILMQCARIKVKYFQNGEIDSVTTIKILPFNEHGALGHWKAAITAENTFISRLTLRIKSDSLFQKYKVVVCETPSPFPVDSQTVIIRGSVKCKTNYNSDETKHNICSISIQVQDFKLRPVKIYTGKKKFDKNPDKEINDLIKDIVEKFKF